MPVDEMTIDEQIECESAEMYVDALAEEVKEAVYVSSYSTENVWHSIRIYLIRAYLQGRRDA